MCEGKRYSIAVKLGYLAEIDHYNNGECCDFNHQDMLLQHRHASRLAFFPRYNYAIPQSLN